jgi:hypothetical protein
MPRPRWIPPLFAAACIVILGAAAPGEEPTDRATKVAATYLDHLIKGRAGAAIDECVDPAGFDRLVFGKDFDELPPERAAYIVQLTSILLKAPAPTAPLDMQLGSGPDGLFKTAAEGSNIRVTFSLFARTPGAQEKRTLSLLVAPGVPEWKIIDIDGLAQTTAAAYEKCKPPPVGGPVPFMEGEVAIVLTRKVQQTTSADAGGQKAVPVRAASDPRAAEIRAELDSLREQIDLYRARDPSHRYPDLAGRGWNDLLQAGYLRRPPANPVNRRTEICTGTSGKATCGWHWDPKTSTLGASYYDEQSGAVTPGKP